MKMAIWKPRSNRLFLRLNQRGSVTIEASISLLVFTMAAASLLLILRDFGYKERVHQALYETVQQMARVDVQTNAECYGLAALLISGRSVSGEGHQLKVAKTELEADGSFQVYLSWQNVIPLGGGYRQTYQLGSRQITRGHDGESGAGQQVYVTETGQKYHLKDCLHLRRSSIQMSRKEAVSSGFEPCWHCIGGLEPFEKAPDKLEP